MVRVFKVEDTEVAPELSIKSNHSGLLDNAGKLVNAGADVLVAGSTVFKSANPKETIVGLKSVNPNTITV